MGVVSSCFSSPSFSASSAPSIPYPNSPLPLPAGFFRDFGCVWLRWVVMGVGFWGLVLLLLGDGIEGTE